MPLRTTPVSHKEKHFDYIVVVIAKLAALVLGVLALGGYAISRLQAESVIGLLTTAIVLLALAGIQDSNAIMREIREHDAQKRLNDQLLAGIQENMANIQKNAEKIEVYAEAREEPEP
jgi:hypothetical protein